MPFLVDNHSPFPHFAFVKTGPDGDDFHVLAVRATFDWVHEGEMTLAPAQAPVVLADAYNGPAEEGEVRVEADLVVGKPRADIHVVGYAHAASGEPAPEWPVGVRVGDVAKTLRVTGPRFWERGAFGFRLTPPAPVARVPLSYRVAYGGTRRRAAERGEETDAFAQNPIGVGYEGRFPIEEPLFAAPQIEAIDRPIRSLSDRPAPEGLGPIPRWWMPRRARLGTLTEAFIRDNPRRLPDDFNWEYYNSAHPDLMAPSFLQGDEHIGTVGLFPEGRSASRLPGYRAIAVVGRASAPPFSALPKLDTLTIDTEARQVSVTWRLTVPLKIGVAGVVLGFAVPGRGQGAGEALYPLRRRA